MNNKTLIHSSILAALFIVAVLGVNITTGYPGAGPFISIDPIGDKNAGEAFTVTGVTDLPAGTEILAQVYPASYEDRTGTGSGEFSGAAGTVAVEKGIGGSNTWSFPLDTSTLSPVEYRVNVSVFAGKSGTGSVETRSPFDQTTFRVLPGSKNPVLPGSSGMAVAGGILIDPIGNTEQGKLLEITGKTNFSAGTPLLVKVIPASFDNETILRDYRNPENAAVIRVVEGDGTNNKFSVGLDTRFLRASDHIILVSDMKDPAAGTDSEPGGWTGSAMFNILSGTSDTNVTEPSVFINPVNNVTAGDPVTITGTTNIPVGSTFRVFILPADSTDYSFPDNAVTVSAVKGSPEANLVSATLATTGLSPGQYIAVVSAEGHEVTGSILFTMK
jgi:hypothetical protein